MIKTKEELDEELCKYCSCTEFGLTKVNTGPWNQCEGRRCDDAYEYYVDNEENIEEEESDEIKNTRGQFLRIIELANKLDWSVEVDDLYDAAVFDKEDGVTFTFGKFSPAGQDFNITINASDTEEMVNEIKERCDNFDCSEEAYLWLDDTGHGKNGAPHDMKDVYEDMECCLEMLKELFAAMKILLMEEE